MTARRAALVLTAAPIVAAFAPSQPISSSCISAWPLPGTGSSGVRLAPRQTLAVSARRTQGLPGVSSPRKHPRALPSARSKHGHSSLVLGMASSTPPPSSAVATVKQGAQIGVGAAAIFALERTLWAASQAAGMRIPTAPVGMLLVFALMLAIHAVSPQKASSVKDWFTPSMTFYSKGVPLFFSPPLVQLPLSLAVLPMLSIFKYLALITAGTLVSIIATGLAASVLVKAGKPEDPAAASTAPDVASTTGRVGTATISISPVTGPSPVLRTAVAGMVVFGAMSLVAAKFEALLIACSSVAALQFGKTLPAKARAVCPPVITCGALTAVLVSVLGMLRGIEASAALAAYKNGLGGVLGGSGIGDILFCGAAPAIVALGFSLYEQRDLLKKNLLAIVGGGAITAVLSVAFTAVMGRLLSLESGVTLSLITRFVTLPMAVPVCDIFGANLGLAAAAVVIQGILGASFGQRLLDKAGVKDDVARGIAIGGTSHALGTASVTASEPKISPPSAVTFLVTGTILCALVQLSSFRMLIKLLIGL